MLKFISVLGNGKYNECCYYIDNPLDKATKSYYIQYALLELLERRGVVPDQIVVFTTKEAHESNWLKNNKNEEEPGLAELLTQFGKRTGTQVKNVMIPTGRDENELWEIFNTIVDNIDQEDEILLDITHSFRYIPMLIFIVLNYTRVIKKCSVKDVYYGAYEASSNGEAPIFVLTPFITMFDWILAVEQYLTTGDAVMLHGLTQFEVSKMTEKINKNKLSIDRVENRLLYKEPNVLRALANSMYYFSETIRNCRGKEITQAAVKLKNDIASVLDSAAHEKIKPLSPIVDLLKQRFDKFSTHDTMKNAIEAAKWCLENRFYQQGLTILQEELITWIGKHTEAEYLNDKIRMSISGSAYKLYESSKNGKQGPVLNDCDLTNDVMMVIGQTVDIRNDINHAGWRKNPAKSNKFKEILQNFIQNTEAVFCRENSNFAESYPDSSKNIKMLLLFSHRLTDRQRQEAEERFGVSEFIDLPDYLVHQWSNIPPELDDLKDYLIPIKEWVYVNGNAGDYALVQGDYGATAELVEYCRALGITPVYASSRRKAVEKTDGEKVTITREFEHVKFRLY